VSILGLVGSELLLRRLDLPVFDACSFTEDYAIPDAELGYAPPPDGTVAGFRLNREGLRGPSLPLPKPADHRRLLFIGDSTCWGLGVPLERTFAALATRALDDTYRGTTIEMVLGAFPGYSTYQSQIMLERLLPTQPDLVVFYVGARNDPSRARYYPDRDIPRRRARLNERWHQLRLLLSLEGIVDRSYRSFFRGFYSDRARARVTPADFRANLDQMAAQLRRAGLPGLVLVPPTSDGLLRDHPIVTTYRDILARWASDSGLAIAPLQPRFGREDRSRVYQEDEYHFSELGHRIAADEIRRVVVTEKLLTEEAATP